MECSLSKHTDYLLSVAKYATATRMSRAYDYQMSHDKVTRFLSTAYFDNKTIWKAAKQIIRKHVDKSDETGIVIVDDSIVEKPHTNENAMICYHWDHSKRYQSEIRYSIVECFYL